MMCRQLPSVLVIVIVFLARSNSNAAVVTQTLGDTDFFGFGGGIVGVNNIPAIDVDKRSVGDPLFTDHDVRDRVFGNDNENDVSWLHDLSAFLPLGSIQSVVVDLALAGIQDGSPLAEDLEDRIFFEGIEVPGALDSVDQGAVGTGLFSFALSGAQIASFGVDGILDVTFDGGRRSRDGALESYFIDFSRVTVNVSVSLEVVIDIKPGSDPNSINLGANGVVPVAILSSTEFDATQVDPETVTLGGAGVAVRGKGNKFLASVEDVNNDGLNDLVLKVETENFDPGQFQNGSAILTGETFGGEAIEGTDTIIIVPPE